MKKIIYCFLFLLFAVSAQSISQVNSDWQWSHPKIQGNDLRFFKMLSASNWVAVGYTGTLVRTTNAGVNWLVYTNYFGTYTSFLGQGKNIYSGDFWENSGVVAGTQGWIARTSNGGASWDSIGSSAGTTALWCTSFGDANTVYIGGNSGLVFKSTNAGLSWTSVTSPSSGANRSIFALDASTVFTGSLGGTIYKSTNGGTGWTSMFTGSSSPIIYGVYFFNANTGFATGASGYVRYTTNGGTSWNVPSVSVTATETRIFSRKNPDEVYLLGDVNNIYKSTDYGSSWVTIPYQYPGQPVPLATNTMDINGNTMVVGGVNGLFNVSTNSGTNWTGISRVLNSYNIYDISYIPSTGKVWAVGSTAASLNNCILYSPDYGNSWEIQSSPDGTDFRSIHMIDINNGWTVGQFGKALKTSNGGGIWQAVTNIPSSNQTLTCVDFVSVNTGWVFGYSPNSIYKTTDGGNSWVTQNSAAPNGARWASMVDANTGYFNTYNITTSLIYKTTNGGTNWEEQSYPNPGNLWKIKMIDANSGYVCGDLGRLYRTTDGGSNWVSVTPPGNNNYTTTDWYNINNGVLGAGSGLSAITTNGGQSWFIKNTGGSAVWEMKMPHPDTIWSAQAFGYIFKYIKGFTPVIEWKNSVPSAYMLKQNYPNPFNPSTTIEFSLPKSGNVVLKLYDIAGREIKRLISGIEFNPGTVRYEFDGTDLASGVYFYKLEAGSFVETKKMVLIK
jgi:photosystem II stability/assembly factor-like uncharacterized protein